MLLFFGGTVVREGDVCCELATVGIADLGGSSLQLALVNRVFAPNFPVQVPDPTVRVTSLSAYKCRHYQQYRAPLSRVVVCASESLAL